MLIYDKSPTTTMDIFSGYKNLIQIHNGDNSQVYRARRVEDDRSVILKVLKADYPTPDKLRRYRQEYYLTSQLELFNVVKAYGLEEWERTLVMILEDFGGISLNQFLSQHLGGLTMAEFLPLAIKIVDGLAQLHGQAIAHKDVNPSNIVLNPETGVVKLIDLGISTQLSRENLILQAPSSLEGTLSYISPEQTGRMNRSLDYRTDFYSLGVTFYELLTGNLPFPSQDPLELVHCHIAKEATAIREVTSKEISPMLSEIVSKLMAKNAEERYQSAWGLKADLEECQNQLAQIREITTFRLGGSDISDRFQIPQKLYGREQEIARLLEAFERICSPQRELILVTGYSGIGKSALVQELYKPITAKRGYFIAGKFDQLQRNIPYSAVVNAFTELVKQLLGEPEAVLRQWRDRLLTALGTNGQVVIDVIPDVELIIGTQPPVPTLGATESQNRFNLVFQHFMQAFCSPKNPLVIFLDDLQWADLATLNLMEKLLGDNAINYLLLIGAYRDHEVSPNHPLTMAIAQLCQKGVAINKIILTPLSLDQIEQLIAETLHSETDRAKGLAELVMRKTEGNPFFVNAFLKALWSENLLVFNHNAGATSEHWQWNLAQIEGMGFTDNVVELMVEQLQKLPQAVQEVLSFAACLGSEFNLTTIALVKNQIPSDVFASLKTVMKQGFLLPRSPLDQNLLIQDYQFAHDRIQQAAYALIPVSKQTIIHYQIGQLLLQQLSPEVREEKIFAIVNHLNNGITLIIDQTERDRLAQLNLCACRKARNANAYAATREYAEIGLNLLGNESWKRQYEITLSLHELSAEVAAISGEFDLMNQWIDAVIDHSPTALEQATVYIIKIQALVAKNKFLEAISSGRSILKQLGVEFLDQPTPENIQQAVQEINILIGDRPIESLFHQPMMLDPTKLAIMQIAAGLVPACFLAGSPLLPMMIILQIKLSIQYGNSPNSAISYSAYSMFLLNFLQDVPTAASFSQLAYRLASVTDAKEVRPHTFLIVGAQTHHRTSHIRETLTILQAGYQSALETGQLEYVGHVGHQFCLMSFWSGQSLMELEPRIRAYYRQLLEFKQLATANFCSIYWETTLLLLGNPDQVEISFERVAEEKKLIEQALASNDMFRLLMFYIHRAMVRFLLGDSIQASIDAGRAEQYLAAGGGVGTICEAGLYFYDSLITLSTMADSQMLSTAQHQKIQENQTKLQCWAEPAPMNHLHKWQLVEAERYRVLGQKLEAIEMYDLAIAGAKEHAYIQEEALANELAAKFYLDWGKENIAQIYMQEAHYCYLHWGAIAKVHQLKTNYSQFFRSEAYSRSLTPHFSLGTTGRDKDALDLTAVMKSSQAIASGIILKNLLQTLMKILLENAGAQTVCLLLHQTIVSEELGQFEIAAHSSTNVDITSGSQPINCALPESILNYVARTREHVLIDDAVKSSTFSQDAYIQSVKPLSVLCYPLIDQGKLVAIVYLENNITTAAFTVNRIELLQLLSGQAAIAITNAKLYAQVRESEQQLKQILEAIPVGIGVLDSNGHPYYANQKARELLGKGIAPEATAAEIAQVYQNYVAETDQLYPNEQLPIVRALRGESSSADDIEIHQADRVIPVEAWGTPIYSETGLVRYAMVVFQDITQRKQAEKILTDYNRTLEQQVADRTTELQRLNQELLRLATSDGLTKIPNRRRFDEYLAIEWMRHLREQQPLALILIDIDYFKRYNDYYGHQGGDECLIQVAQTLAQTIQRSTDLVARYGGEEFAVILPTTNQDGALIIAQSIRSAIASLAIPHQNSDVSDYVTLSLGISTLIPSLDTSPENLIANADAALYAAKEQGRDRIMFR